MITIHSLWLFVIHHSDFQLFYLHCLLNLFPQFVVLVMRKSKLILLRTKWFRYVKLCGAILGRFLIATC